METLKNKILTEGSVIGSGILKVDSFLNHQIDVKLFNGWDKNLKKDLQIRKLQKY